MGLLRNRAGYAEKTFYEPLQGGLEIRLRMRPLDKRGGLIALRNAARFQARYHKCGLRLGNGEVMEICQNIALTVCFMAEMQCGPKKDRYTPEEIAAMMINTPTAYFEIAKWASRIQKGKEGI